VGVAATPGSAVISKLTRTRKKRLRSIHLFPTRKGNKQLARSRIRKHMRNLKIKGVSLKLIKTNLHKVLMISLLILSIQ
jgi:hypothetical protein